MNKPVDKNVFVFRSFIFSFVVVMSVLYKSLVDYFMNMWKMSIFQKVTLNI